ncbi:MAG: hypothetical protein BYD32DRAFT_196395 [Podila humilis]|nr:MAG: hypothetical protein BYD32DRAFT_196395 [Podila humilis]
MSRMLPTPPSPTAIIVSNTTHQSPRLPSPACALYTDFFVFRDTALTLNLPLPFTSAPVDVLAKLTEIENKAYMTDFAFHKDLFDMASSLNDAHVNYYTACYSGYGFQIAYRLCLPDRIQSLCTRHQRQASKSTQIASRNNMFSHVQLLDYQLKRQPSSHS